MAQPLVDDPIDLALGDDDDLIVTTDLAFVRGLAGVAQMCRIAVQMFAGEWFLDLDVGIPYWEDIFGAPAEVALLSARAGFRDELLAVDGVLDIVSLVVTFDNARSRQLTVSWQVRTAIGNTPVDTMTVAPGSQ